MSGKTIDIDLEVIDKGNNKYTVKMDKPVCSEIKFPCIKIITAILVFSLLAGIAMFIIAKICNLEIVISVALVLLAIIVMLIFSAKVLKPFAKMAFLGEIINNDIDKDYLQSLKDMELRDLVKEGIANQRDLIKKFCDTLAEL